MGLDGAMDGTALSNDTADDDDDDFKLKFCTVCASNQNRSMEAHLQLSTTGHFPVLSFGTGSLVRLPGPTISQPNVYPFNTTSYGAMYAELAAKDPKLYRQNGLLAMLDRNRGVKWGPERFQDWRVGVPRLEQARGRELDVPGAPDAGPPGATEQQQQAQQAVAAAAGAGGGPAGALAPAPPDQQPHHRPAGTRRLQVDKGAAGVEAGVVDVIVTCEERCWDAVVDDLLARGAPLNRPVHVFNVDIKDNHEEALVGGRAILDLAKSLNEAAREERRGARAGGGGGGAEGWREGFDERVPGVLAEWQERGSGLPALWTCAWF